METAHSKKITHEKDDLFALKEAVDINFLLDSLGIKATKDTAREIRASCVIHGGDNKSAFRFNKERRSWQCFTNKCHETHGGDIIGLIQGVLGIDFIGALNHLKDMVGDIEGFKKTLSERKFERDRRGFEQQYARPEVPSYVSEEALKAFSPLRSSFFLKEENGAFKAETLNHFEVAGGFTDSYSIVRDVIPIRNIKGNLVAYSLRDTRRNPPDEDNKYILTPGFIKDKVLYNLQYAKMFGAVVPLVVVEGFKSVWRLYEYGIYNVISCVGSAVLPGQIELIKAYATKGVILMLDPDKAGLHGMETAIKDIPKEIPTYPIYMKKEEGGSPAELTFDQAYGYLYEFIR